MATIETRHNDNGSTSYRVKIRLRGRTESKTFARKTDAKQWAESRQTAIRNGEAFGSARKTIAEAVGRYMEEELPKLAKKAQEGRRQQLAWWTERRGVLLLNEVTRAVVTESLTELRGMGPAGAPVSFATTQRYRASLGALLSCAVEDWHWLQIHPLRGGGRRKRAKGEREVERERELSPDERARLWAACRESGNPSLYALVVCAFASGGREDELLGIKWDALTLDPLIYDPASGEKRPGVPRVEVSGKNGESRILYFPGEAAEIMRQRSAEKVSPYVFYGRRDLSRHPLFPKNAFADAKRRAKLNDFRFHDLRHCWAVNLLEEGATMAELMIMGGWKSYAMVRRYAKRAHREGAASAALMERMGKR